MSQQRWGDRYNTLMVILFPLGLLAAWGASSMGWSRLIGVGIALCGLGIAFGGLGDVLTRRISLTNTHEDHNLMSDQTYVGTIAVVFGVTWMMVGVLAIVGGLVYALGMDEALLAYLGDRPGIPMVVIGLPVMTWGITTVVGPHEYSLDRSLFRFILSAPGRVFSVLVLLAGFASVVLGLDQILLPAHFDRFLGQLNALLPHLPG